MQTKINELDHRRHFAIPGNREQTIAFCVQHFLLVGRQAIEQRGLFSVALAGGSTPKAVYEQLAWPENAEKLDWTKVQLFWGDERPVALDHPKSNYKMAMDAAFGSLPIRQEHIFPMEAENNSLENARKYEETIKQRILSDSFDLVILGMGQDGHTASLFPHTQSLQVKNQLVHSYFVPQQDSIRMTLTYECINAAHSICILAMGKEKAQTVERVFYSEENIEQFPVQNIGTKITPALWILDTEAGAKVKT